MKFHFEKKTALVVAVAMALSIFAGCGGCHKNKWNNEEDIAVFSTQALDGVFSPFFSTSATDGNMAGMTQIGMLGNDEKGNPSFGPDEAVVVEDYEIIPKGSGEDQTSEYRFVLKNDIRFSNGSYLTIKDVLFNLYVYLDPVYTGSSTIYSTDIVGLKEYRTQEADENEQDAFMGQFQTAAQTRIDALVDATEDIFDEHDSLGEQEFRAQLEALQSKNPSTYPNIVKDFDKTVELFREELNTDYSNSIDSYADFTLTNEKGEEVSGQIKSDVEMFLYNEGAINWNKKANNGAGGFETGSEILLDDVRSTWGTGDAAKAKAIQYVYEMNIPDNIDQVVQYWMTAGELFTFITNEELEAHFKNEEKAYKNISGIKFANRTSSVTVHGKTYGVPTYEDNTNNHVTSGNEVLSITIKKVDPKAIWNFAFAVAPMYYYSDAAHISKFDYEENFGVEYASQTFMQNVVGDPAKNGVPVGAGPYAASKTAGGLDNVGEGDFFDGSIVYFERNPYYFKDSKSDKLHPATIKTIRFQVAPEASMLNMLYSNAIDFVEPNAKTETFNEVRGKAKEGIGNKEVMTSGYGYIGINAGKVPSLKVRQAIMHCIDTSECVKYYGTHAEPIYRSMTKANWVHDKALKNKTAYYPYIAGPIPEDLTVVNPDYAEFVRSKGKKTGQTLTAAEQEEFIRKIIESDGYRENAAGVYQNSSGTDVLNYRFTIVGNEKDHPAFQAMWHAMELLNNWGFKVDVKTDIQGLQKLSSGSLTVWAAAWGSTIDPDMYQVYHKDSTATSVLNWGYRQILLNAGNKYYRELTIVNDLSLLIEQARETTVEDQRARLYSDALDLVMELAVELPTYQRNDLFVYNVNKLDEGSFFQNPTPFKGLTSDIHTVSLKVK